MKHNLPNNLLFCLSSTSTSAQSEYRSEENNTQIVLPPPPSASVTSFSHNLDLSNLTLPLLSSNKLSITNDIKGRCNNTLYNIS